MFNIFQKWRWKWCRGMVADFKSFGWRHHLLWQTDSIHIYFTLWCFCHPPYFLLLSRDRMLSRRDERGTTATIEWCLPARAQVMAGGHRAGEEDGDIATTGMRAVYVEPPLPQLAGWQLVYFCCHSLPPRWTVRIATVSVVNVDV